MRTASRLVRWTALVGVVGVMAWAARDAWANAAPPPRDIPREQTAQPAPQRVSPASVEVNRAPAIRVPAGAAGVRANFQVRRAPDQEVSRLIIPRKYLPAVPASEPAQPAAANLRQRSMYAGIMLSAVIAAGGLGVVLVRRRRFGWAAATCVAIVALAAFAGTAMADLAVPGRPPSRPAPNPPRVVAPPAAQVTVEITDAGDDVVLILGKNSLRLAP